MKKVEKILTTWFIVFTTVLFVLERVWAQVITSPVSLYLYIIILHSEVLRIS